MSERAKLERELRKCDTMIKEALDKQAEAEYQYESWRKEKSNVIKAISALDGNKAITEDKE